MVHPSTNRITELVGITLMISLFSIHNKKINFITGLLVLVVWLFWDLMAFNDSVLVYREKNRQIGYTRVNKPNHLHRAS